MNKKVILIPATFIAIIIIIGFIISNNKREEMPIYALTMEDLLGFDIDREYDDGINHVYYTSYENCKASVMYDSKDNYVKMISFSGNDQGSAYSGNCLEAFGNITKNPKLIAQNNETKNMVTDLASSFITKSVDNTNIEASDDKNKVRFVFLDKIYPGDHGLKYQLKVTRDYNGLTKKAEDFEFSIDFIKETEMQ